MIFACRLHQTSLALWNDELGILCDVHVVCLSELNTQRCLCPEYIFYDTRTRLVMQCAIKMTTCQDNDNEECVFMHSWEE